MIDAATGQHCDRYPDAARNSGAARPELTSLGISPVDRLKV